MTSIRTEDITTAEQLLELPSKFDPCELVRGKLILKSPNGCFHGRIAGCLLGRLGRFADDHGLGFVFPGNTGFLLERNEDSVRCADAAFVRAARLPPKSPDDFIPGAPDMAVEVRSPDDKFHEILAKFSHFFETGTRVIWDVDSETQTVTVYRASGRVETLSGDAVVTEPELLPGFAVAIKDIFVW